MIEINQVVKEIQEFCHKNVLKKTFRKNKEVHEYHETWEPEKIGEKRTSATLNAIWEHLKTKFPGKINYEELVDKERYSRFDFYIPETKTAIEICLGNIKNEFHKDVLKALEVKEKVKELIIFTREYATSGKEDAQIKGSKWINEPAQTNTIKFAKELGLSVQHKLLLP